MNTPRPKKSDYLLEIHQNVARHVSGTHSENRRAEMQSQLQSLRAVNRRIKHWSSASCSMPLVSRIVN